MKNRIAYSILTFFVLYILSSCAKDIVDLTGNISGTVKDYSGGQFIENCKVSLSPGGKSTTTASNGVYEFNDLQPGDYTLSFSKAGYNDESTSVTVVAGQTANVSAMLKAKSAFVLSETVLDFGDLESSKIFYAFNNSDADCLFTISNSPSWLSLSQERGTVKAGSSESISATIDRNSVGYGEFSQTLNVAYSGKTSGSVSLIVRFTKVQLTAPKVSIADKAENITQNSFDIKGTIEATGGSLVTSYGHCWSTSANPTVNDNKTTLGSTASTGPFTSNITNLAMFTTYYVRAYATNDQGTTYSQQMSVTTQDVESDKWDGEIAKSFAGGKGTNVDPYIIKTGGQLLLIKDYKDKYFELGGNINLDNHNWLPIVNFSGMIDGKGYEISNLRIERTGKYIGLFGSTTSNAKIKNITIKGVNIISGESNCVGSLIGSNEGFVLGCNVYLLENSMILGNTCVGGVIGGSTSDSSNLEECHVFSYSDDFVILGNDSVGGVVGSIGEGVVTSCSSEVKIKGGMYCGGIAGQSVKAKINQCFFEGAISGESYVGGITGSSYSEIRSCCSNVSISVSGDYSGGITGLLAHNESIISCYSSGNISLKNGAKFTGGIIGGNDNEALRTFINYIENSYSAVESTIVDFWGFSGGYTKVSDCATISDVGASYNYSTLINSTVKCKDISVALKENYSNYASDWNFHKTWIWEGTIDGEPVKVSCPRLAWE